MVSRIFFFLLVITTAQNAAAWSPVSYSLLSTNNKAQRVDNNIIVDYAAVTPAEDETAGSPSDACESRRLFFSVAAMEVCLLVGAAPAIAADATVYKSGKSPIVPGQKPKDKSDTKGTKKDPDFLRSISDCRNQCQATNGPDGFARSKEDCLSECQDICCATYEQCTFNIVPRL